MARHGHLRAVSYHFELEASGQNAEGQQHERGVLRVAAANSMLHRRRARVLSFIKPHEAVVGSRGSRVASPVTAEISKARGSDGPSRCLADSRREYQWRHPPVADHRSMRGPIWWTVAVDESCWRSTTHFFDYRCKEHDFAATPQGSKGKASWRTLQVIFRKGQLPS